LAAEQGLERKAAVGEGALLLLADPIDYFLGRQAAGVPEAFRDAVEGAWTGDDEVVLVLIEQRGIVEVDRELEGEEGPGPGAEQGLHRPEPLRLDTQPF
jgi:hypothetical protein